MDEGAGVEGEGVRDGEELDHVEAALAAFVFGHERLGFAEALGDGGLSQAAVDAPLDEQACEAVIVVRESRLGHRAPRCARRQVEPKVGLSQNGISKPGGLDMTETSVDLFSAEYEQLFQKAETSASDERIIELLVAEHDWTQEGAKTLVELARRYGTFILRNALALAVAMRIEDGDCGL